MAFFIFLLVAFIGLGILQSIMKEVKQKKASAYFKQITINSDLDVSHSYLNPEAKSIILMSSKRKTILFSDREVSNNLFNTNIVYNERRVNFADILKIETIVGGETISSKSVGNAVAGGILFGAVGAIVGSNTGKTTYKKNVDSVKLKLYLNDLDKPTYEFYFYDKKLGGDAKLAQSDCQLWQDRIGVILANNAMVNK